MGHARLVAPASWGPLSSTFLVDRCISVCRSRTPHMDLVLFVSHPRPAVEQFTQRVFGLPSRTFFPAHAKLLGDLRHLLVPAELARHADVLAGNMQQLLPRCLPDGEQVRASRPHSTAMQIRGTVPIIHQIADRGGHQWVQDRSLFVYLICMSI